MEENYRKWHTHNEQQIAANVQAKQDKDEETAAAQRRRWGLRVAAMVFILCQTLAIPLQRRLHHEAKQVQSACFAGLLLPEMKRSTCSTRVNEAGTCLACRKAMLHA